MNRWAIIALSVLLPACVTTPDSRPEAFLNSEALLREGLNAYQNDNFSDAEQKFSQALALYQSFDNQHGMALSQLNLAETALASSDFAKAQGYLTQVKAIDLAAESKRKMTLLEVKLQFEQQHYQAALHLLKPLLINIDAQQKLNEAQLNLLALQAKLEVWIAPLAKSTALARFETAVTQQSPPVPSYQVLLKRLLARRAFKRGDYQSATLLLTEALAYYKEQAKRRSIASCLEELAEIEIAQQHYDRARGYLNRALVIWQWLKNDSKSDKIRAQLITIQKR